MNDQNPFHSERMLAVGKDARIPEEIQQISQDSVSKTRELYHQINAVATGQLKALEDVVQASQAGFKSLTEKMAENTAANTEAVFEAVQAIARAKTIPEAGRLQAEFMQQQFATATAQAQELFNLSLQASHQTLATINEATTRSFDKFKAAS